jgi:hypothetical protein
VCPEHPQLANCQLYVTQHHIHPTVAGARSVFLEVAENISDLNIATFNGNWLSIPGLIQEHLTARFEGKSPSSELSM